MGDHAVTLILMDEAPTREKIEALEAAILKMPQTVFKTHHALAGRVYARTIFLPAGATLTGAVHKKDHINIVHGDITAWTEDGMKRFTGFHVIESRAGAKRAGFAHSETTWTTVCQTDEVDMLKIEADLVENPERLQSRIALPLEPAALEN